MKSDMNTYLNRDQIKDLKSSMKVESINEEISKMLEASKWIRKS